MAEHQPETLVESEESRLLPWPSYRKYFQLISGDSKNLTVKCVLCAPATKILSVGISSASNLKKHITKVHPHHVKALLDNIQAQKRPAQDEGDGPAKKQLGLECLQDGGRKKACHIADRAGFRELIEGIRPDRKLITRKPLMGHINQAYLVMKEKLIDVLSKQNLVCTTADCWTA